ncbi:MAG: hypothetical protein WCC87_14535 [Candidatus Korobacteraceae bacterium]
MTLQGQLAQSQALPERPLQDFSPCDLGLLGNKSTQAPRISETDSLAGEFQVWRATVITSIETAESTEMAWLEENAQELGRHKGEWLLIHGRELLMHSRDFAAVRVAIRERHIDSPFVYYVPTDEESNSVTI